MAANKERLTLSSSSVWDLPSSSMQSSASHGYVTAQAGARITGRIGE